MSAARDNETGVLIEHLRARRRRRRRRRFLLTGLGAAVAVAGIVTGVVLATGSSEGRTSGSMVSAKAGVSASAPSTSGTHQARPATAEAAGPVTTASPSTTEPATTSTTTWLTNKVVVVDPGHQARANHDQEPVGPGSAQTKAKVSSGTAGVTGTPESEVVLAIGLKLRDALEPLGVQVVMTRTVQDVDVSNSERAEIGNSADADLVVRLHCNGSTDGSIHGLFTLYPASIPGWTDDIAEASKRAAAIVQREAIAATGAKDRGLHERSDLTGFNWSDVPSILVEMGFMTNAAEDRLLGSGTYQDKIVQGLVNGIVDFLRTE